MVVSSNNLGSSLISATSPVNSFSISQIITAANTLKSYVLANKILPTIIIVSNIKISIDQFSLMSISIKNINNKNTSKILLSSATASNPSGMPLIKLLNLLYIFQL